MQAAKMRKSDILLKKREPSNIGVGVGSRNESVEEEGGRQSLSSAMLDGGTAAQIVEDFVSSALDHSMCSNGNCLRENRFSAVSINKNANSAAPDNNYALSVN